MVDCAADLGTMRADQTRIRQALLNLASNANKFTERGTVTIAARRATEAGREWVTMAVDRHRHRHDARADGQPLPGFRPGRCLDHAQIRRHRPRPGDQPALLPDDGRRHHGESEPGRGSTFTIRLPAEVGAVQPAAAVRDVGAARGSGAAAPGAADVLVVDDDPTVRDMIERHPHARGLRGRDGERWPRGAAPRARTPSRPRSRSTCMMPDLDGWTVLAAIKGDPELADIPVVLVTIVDEKNRGYALGATDYMVKPVDRDAARRSRCAASCGAPGRPGAAGRGRRHRCGAACAVRSSRTAGQVSEAENGRVALGGSPKRVPT